MLIGTFQTADEILSGIHMGFRRGRELSFLAFFLFGAGLTILVLASFVTLSVMRHAFRVTGVLVRRSKSLEQRQSLKPVGHASNSQQDKPSGLVIFLWIMALVTTIGILANTVAVLLILIQEHALGGGGGEFLFRAFNKLLEQTVLPFVLVAVLIGLAGLVDRLDGLRPGSSQDD